MTKVKCRSCGSEMDSPHGMELTPVHICARCFEHQPPELETIPPGQTHIEMDLGTHLEPSKGTLLGREDEYFDILYPIESTIVEFYKQNPKLKDRDVVKALKGILAKKTLKQHRALQNDIQSIVEKNAELNQRTAFEVRICYKYVLASVKRHHAVGGQRGYLEFIAECLEGHMP